MGRDFFLLWVASLALSHTPIFYLRYLFFIHQIWTEDKFFFLSCFEACLFAACHIFSCSFSSKSGYDHLKNWWIIPNIHTRKSLEWSMSNYLLIVTQTALAIKHCHKTAVIPKVCQGRLVMQNSPIRWWHFYGKLSPQLLPYLNSLCHFVDWWWKWFLCSLQNYDI